MHPIEQLRYVARASGADAGLLVQEATSALSYFDREPHALVTAGRRLLTRQPAVGPLWWMAARMCTAMDPRAEARTILDEIYNDPTPKELAHGLPSDARVLISGWPDQTLAALPRRGDVSVLVLDVEGQGHSVVRRLERADVVVEDVDPAHVVGAVEESTHIVVEAAVLGPAAALVDVGSVAAAAVAKATHTPVWLVAGVGRQLPEMYWQAVVERTADPDLPAFLAPFEVLSLGLVDRVVGPTGVLLTGELGPSSCPIAQELLSELR